jgi:hypothetical protein
MRFKMANNQKIKTSFWKLKTKTLAWTSSEAGYEHPLLVFNKGILKAVNKQWKQIKIESVAEAPYNNALILLICHDCNFIFDDSAFGINEHNLFHSRMQEKKMKT